MVSLGVGQAKEALLEKVAAVASEGGGGDGGGQQSVLFLVPKAEADVLQAVGIGHAGDAVLAPSEGPGTSVVVGEVFAKRRSAGEGRAEGGGQMRENGSRLQASPSWL